MISEFLGVEKETVEKMASDWTEWKRIYTWNKKERQTEKDVNDFYINMPNEYACSIEMMAKRDAPKLLMQLGNVKGLRILDFGCGTGYYGTLLAEQGAIVDFLDFDNIATKFLRWRLEKKGIKNCRYIADIENSAENYDIIICVDVLEHLNKPTDVMKLLSGKLSRGGRMLLTTPLTMGIDGHFFYNPLDVANGEHTETAIKNWFGKKTNEWIKKNYIKNGDVFTKTDITVLLLYNYSQHTTGRFIEDALKHKCITITNRMVPIAQNGENIREVVKQFNVDFILQVESGGFILIPKNVGCKTAFYSIDTFDHRATPTHLIDRHDVKLYAQKIFANDSRSFFVPLGADVGIYRPLRTKKIYDIAFCGTVLQDALHEKRNAIIKEVAKNCSFYYGKDSNEYANLRYNEAHFVLNYGIADDLNMRVFEAMASGSILLMNKVATLHDYFMPGEHYLEYENADDIRLHLENAQANPEKIIQMSKRAVELIGEHHTYGHRVDEIIKIMQK